MLRQVPHERIEGLINSQSGLDETTVKIRRNRFGANIFSTVGCRMAASVAGYIT